MADNSHEGTSPAEAPNTAANQQHLFESALLVDPSYTSATTPPAAPEQIEPVLTSEPTPAAAETGANPAATEPTPTEAVAIPSDKPAQTSESAQPAPPNRSNTAQSIREPRHCWICLTDEGQDSTTNDWRSPCSCNLTAHEECLLQWISETESTSRKEGLPRQKIQCPQCKSEIRVERPAEFLVLLEELLAAVGRQLMLPAGVFMVGGLVYSGSMVYGFNVLELVFGADGGRCLVAGLPAPYSGTKSLIERAPFLMKKVFDLFDTTLSLMSPFMPKHPDSWLFWLSPWIAPTLLISRTGFADRLFGAMTLPSLLYVGYQALADPRNSPIFSWPPSPGIALLSLPYLRSAYLETYRQLFSEHEKRWRLAIQRHPREGETAEEIAAGAENDGIAMGDHVLGIEIELVDEEDEVLPAAARQQQEDLADIQRQANELVREVEALQAIQRQQGGMVEDVPGAANIEQLRAAIGDAPAAPAAAAQPVQNGPRLHLHPQRDGAVPPAPAANAQAPQINGEPAAAPAARPQPNGWEFRQNVSIFAVARTCVATLLFPAASSVIGDLLELTLPKTWVTPPSIPLSTGGFLAGLATLWSGKKSNVVAGTWKRGLLQEKWGRTIVGGMVVVGLKDAVELYVLWRRARIEGQRKVLNHGEGEGTRRSARGNASGSDARTEARRAARAARAAQPPHA